MTMHMKIDRIIILCLTVLFCLSSCIGRETGQRVPPGEYQDNRVNPGAYNGQESTFAPKGVKYIIRSMESDSLSKGTIIELAREVVNEPGKPVIAKREGKGGFGHLILYLVLLLIMAALLYLFISKRMNTLINRKIHSYNKHVKSEIEALDYKYISKEEVLKIVNKAINEQVSALKPLTAGKEDTNGKQPKVNSADQNDKSGKNIQNETNNQQEILLNTTRYAAACRQSDRTFNNIYEAEDPNDPAKAIYKLRLSLLERKGEFEVNLASAAVENLLLRKKHTEFLQNATIIIGSGENVIENLEPGKIEKQSDDLWHVVEPAKIQLS